MAAQWAQFLSTIDPTAGEFRRQQAFVEDQKTRKLNRIIAEMEMEEAQKQIERREKFRTTLKEIGDKYASQSKTVTNNIPEGYYSRIAQIESGGDPTAVSPTGATGLYQFTRGTGEQYGLVGEGFDRRTDPKASQAAVEAFTADNAAALQRAGIQPTEAMLYLAHQQGVGGARAIISAAANGTDVPPNIRRNMDLNGGAGLSPAEFLAKWENKYNATTSPEEAQAKQMLVEEKGYPAELVDGVQQVINDPNPTAPETARRNIQMLAFEFPEFIQEQGNAVAAIEDMDNAKYRKVAKQLKDDVVKAVQSGDMFSDEIEQKIIGLSVMSGDVSPLMDYFKSKREGKDSLAKYDKPSDVFTDQRVQSLAKSIDADPAAFGFDPDEWESRDVDERLAEAQDIAAQTQEDYVGGQWANQGWKRGVAELNAFRETALRRNAERTLGGEAQEPQTLQEDIQPGQVINWSDM